MIDWLTCRTTSMTCVCNVGGLKSHRLGKQWRNPRDRIGRCLRYNLYIEADQDRKIQWSGVWIDVEFCTSTASNGSHVAQSQHLLSFLFLASTGNLCIETRQRTPEKLLAALQFNKQVAVSRLRSHIFLDAKNLQFCQNFQRRYQLVA